nr:pleckstrin homology domain-containing family O member 2 [Pogona vitticeps]
MEDGVKEETPEKPKCPIVVDKAGWIKKSSGGLLSLWKERYIQLCKSQLLMYENEEEQKCVETVELERYDRCQDLRALLKRRNRFILIRAPGCKVQDIKFQASSGEEKESWMKALNEGINRGKNRILDEVKVDESLSLEHVTRRRAKVAQGRRPPTRSHLKEVASAMSDGILRLDLDVPDSSPPNITVVVSDAADVPLPKETPKPPMPPIKPLMPPTEEPRTDSAPEDQEVKKPPVPPAKPPKDAGAPGETMNSVKEEQENGDGAAVPGEEDVASKMEAKRPPALPAKPPKEGAAASENTDSVRMMEEEQQQRKEKDDAVIDDEGEEPKVELDGESLEEANHSAPVPPPKILPDKVKVTWDSPASEEPEAVPTDPSTAGSKEDLQEIVKPPTPPPKIISERLKASMASQRSSLDKDVGEGNSQHQEPKAPMNGFAGNGVAEPVFQDGEEALQGEQRGCPEHGATVNVLPSKDQPPGSMLVRNSPATKPRCSSVGDLLSGPTKDSLPGHDLWQGPALRVARMEHKVACEQERTEKLLQKVLQGGLEEGREGNGPPVSAEMLLNEAAEQLRQATQVLKEVRDFGELKKEPAERRKGVAKDLVTLYRRSAP